MYFNHGEKWCGVWRWGTLRVLRSKKLLKTLLHILSKGFAMIDSFSSDKFLGVKSHLIRNLHFPSLQNAFWGGPLPKPGPMRPAKKSEPLPHVAETLLLAHYP